MELENERHVGGKVQRKSTRLLGRLLLAKPAPFNGL